ncbi:hypothetical protein DPMN_146307 [Dreissena polymorpha]|uniref:Uncharacterized protein n=1 Tax=Dreissena polymorpha TaxID=45954 RepID=A0A9D4F8D6_DREPO|nr:hypothetical protein DPMN_146307 [Dreissena polymorpha]
MARKDKGRGKIRIQSKKKAQKVLRKEQLRLLWILKIKMWNSMLQIQNVCHIVNNDQYQ